MYVAKALAKSGVDHARVMNLRFGRGRSGERGGRAGGGIGKPTRVGNSNRFFLAVLFHATSILKWGRRSRLFLTCSTVWTDAVQLVESNKRFSSCGRRAAVLWEAPAYLPLRPSGSVRSPLRSTLAPGQEPAAPKASQPREPSSGTISLLDLWPALIRSPTSPYA